MSTWSERELTCSACAASVRARVALGAHTGRAPQIRDAILARRFHLFTCACGATISVDTDFEYTDIERRQLFLVGRVSERTHWREHEQQLHRTIERVLQLGSPLVTPFVHGLTSRVVFGLEALREKLVLDDAALDDALVECIKIRAYANDPTLAAPGSRIVVDAVTANDALACLWFPKPDAAPDRALELPPAWVAAALDDRASLEARFPELFGGGYVDAARLLPSARAC